MIPNKTGTHVVMKPDSESNGPPGIVDKEYDFGKHQRMQAKLDQLQSARIGILKKEKIAKEVLDLDEAVRMGTNLMAAGLMEDWDFDIQS